LVHKETEEVIQSHYTNFFKSPIGCIDDGYIVAETESGIQKKVNPFSYNVIINNSPMEISYAYNEGFLDILVDIWKKCNS